MGLWLSRLLSLFGDKEARILVRAGLALALPEASASLGCGSCSAGQSQAAFNVLF